MVEATPMVPGERRRHAELKVTIPSLIDAASINACLTFATECGTARGTWMGERPCVGGSYEAELEVPDTLVWGDNVITSAHPGCYLAADNDHVIIQGLMEDMEPVGETTVCTLRIAASLVSIETTGTLPPAGVWVRLRTPRLLLYDVKL
jgi:hypothetical protein